MKKYFWVLLIIALLFTGVGITLMRGPDNGRDSNRDYQRESYPLGSDENWVKRVGIDSDLDLEDGPLKTNRRDCHFNSS